MKYLFVSLALLMFWGCDVLSPDLDKSDLQSNDLSLSKIKDPKGKDLPVVLESDGNDWYNLPVPSSDEVGDDWEIEFDYYPANITTGYVSILCLGDYNYGFGWSELTVDQTKDDIGVVVSNYDGLLWVQPICYNVLTANAWHHIKISKSSGKIYLEVNSNSISEDWESDVYNFSCGTIGAYRQSTVNGNADPTNFLPYGTKFKNLEGTFWEFGAAYSGSKKAQPDDYVSLIKNKGSVLGNITQSNPDAQMRLVTE